MSKPAGAHTQARNMLLLFALPGPGILFLQNHHAVQLISTPISSTKSLLWPAKSPMIPLNWLESRRQLINDLKHPERCTGVVAIPLRNKYAIFGVYFAPDDSSERSILKDRILWPPLHHSSSSEDKRTCFLTLETYINEFNLKLNLPNRS